MRIKILAVLTFIWMAGIAFSQEQAPTATDVRVFRLDYVLKELEAGKVINSRAYATLLSTDTPGFPPAANVIRAGNKVPIPTGGAAGLQYQDVGVNIDSKFLKEMPNQLVLGITAEVSSV